MGYAMNVALSIPMAIIIYFLTEKLIIGATSENKFMERVQKSFVIGFIIGLAYIALAMNIFGEGKQFDNQALQLAMYGAGGFLVLNSVVINWNVLDEGTKIILLGLMIAGLVVYSFTKERSYQIYRKNKKNKNRRNK